MRLFFYIFFLLLSYSQVTFAEFIVPSKEATLWNILRQQFVLTHEKNNPLVQMHIQWFYQHPNYLYNSLQKAQPWLYFILQETQKRHLPAEIVLLPIIESAYNPLAKNSYSGATGLWQLQRETAADYGIHKNGWFDEREDVITSTRAALDHLVWLNDFFNGDWLLTFAAYDAGQGNIQNAIRYNLHHHLPTNFWSLPLPKETRDYVPRLLALAYIIQQANLKDLPPIPNQPYLILIKTHRLLSLKHAAVLAHLSIKQLKELNPGYNLNAPVGLFRFVLPRSHAKIFSQNLAALTHSAASPVIIHPYMMKPGDTLYLVKNGDNLDKIANHFKLDQTDILASNEHLTHNPLPGQILIIPTHKTFLATA